MALVVDFHGLSEGAVAHAQMSGFAAFAKTEGFVAAVPQGTGAIPSWGASPAGAAMPGDADIAFVGALLDQIEAAACIDTSRVYATGLSNGAMMTSLVACRMADRFAAVAPVAGVTDFKGCAPSHVVPMLTIHGTKDPILLFNGGIGDIIGRLFGGSKTGTTSPPTTTIPTDLNGPGYPANAKAWALRNGCDPTPADTKVSGEVTLRTYRCPPGADVEMYVIAGGGHAWPGSQFSRNLEPVIGYTTFDIDATKLIWAFFQRFRHAPSTS